MRRTVGKTENSKASFIYIVIRSMTSPKAIFTRIKKSRSAVGSGIMIAITINTMNTTKALLAIFLSILSSPLHYIPKINIEN